MQRQKPDELQQLLENSEMENNHSEQNTIEQDELWKLLEEESRKLPINIEQFLQDGGKLFGQEDSEMEKNHSEQNTIKEHKLRFLHSFGCIVFSILIICIIIFLITNLM